MVRLRGKLICMSEEERQSVLVHRAEHIRLTRAETGCLTFDIDDSDDPMVFEVMESFRDRPAFEAHQTRTRQSQWFDATRHILRDFMIEEIGD